VENGRLSSLRCGCPDFNAIERLWLHLKSQWFTGFTARTEEALMDRLLTAFASLFARSGDLSSQCRV
jgi:transposase